MLVDNFLRKQLSELPEPLRATIADPAAVLGLAGIQQVVCTTTSLFTVGKPLVSHFFAVQDQTLATKNHVLQVAGSMGAKSRSPLFQALTQAARESSLPLREMEVDGGENGLLAKLERTWYVVGNKKAMEEEAIELGVTSQTLAGQWEAEGREIVFLAQKQPKRLLAIFAASMPVNPEAPAVIKQLDELGIEVVLLTDQKTRVAKGWGDSLGIRLIHSELGPDEKKGILEALQDSPSRTAAWCTLPTLPLVPEGMFTLLSTTRLSAGKAPVLVRSLAELPEQIKAARALVAAARKRYFWLKLPA